MDAYLQQPAIYGDNIVFVTDDDLWTVNRFGGVARRLTTSKGMVKKPMISPDGKNIAYLNNENGQWDLFLIPLEGGHSRRLTFTGIVSIFSWDSSKEIQFRACHESFHPRAGLIYKIDINSNEIKEVKIGPASGHLKKGSFELIARNLGDPAVWKRYKGGTAGTLWTKNNKSSKFKQILKSIKGNIANPTIIEDRIFFISDHEGIGNIYSCTLTGKSIKRITNEKEYYVRSFSFHNDLISYQCAGDIFVLELEGNKTQQVSISVYSNFNQANFRYESCENYLQDYSFSQRSDFITLISRGKLYSTAPFIGGPIKLGNDTKRYRFSRYVTLKGKKKDELSDKERIIAVELNQENEESLVLIDEHTNKIKGICSEIDFGKIYDLNVSHDGSLVAITTNRKELFIYNVHKNEIMKIATGDAFYINDLSWSPDDSYLAFVKDISLSKRAIFVYEVKTQKAKQLITPVLSDSSPSWDPNGDYLYFLSIRDFLPVYNETHFDLGFPFATGAYAVVLNKDAPSPLDICKIDNDEDEDNEDESQEEQKESKKSQKKKEEEPLFEIDWDGLDDRIVTLPVEQGGTVQIYAAKDKFFYLKSEVKGISPQANWLSDDNTPTLYCYNLKEMKKETWQAHVIDIEEARDSKHFLAFCEDGLRVISKETKPTEGEAFNKKDGWVNLERVKVDLNPKNEWKQMFQEAWILQREHFWTKDMSKINWQTVFKRYYGLIDKVNTRSEFSDLLWEMQGELGTSHCYEMLGDYNRIPNSYKSGHLGAHLKFLGPKKGFLITKITQGDSWIKDSSSPLSAPAVSLKKGDVILKVNGQELLSPRSLEEELVNRAGEEVCISAIRKGEKELEHYDIKTISNNQWINYREWVTKNRDFVHKKTKGKIGYVHVPNMSIWGYSEFYRSYISESEKEGLIIDVRYNGGGNVSQHLLKILKQKVIGFDTTRYFGIEKYPNSAINGPIVCLTNEHAGSDGDIFSHAFKLMKIGKLIGKRTWGGVIGIWPRLGLNDGSLTTQPEFSHWFEDVGYDVENYGTEPDIEVDILPSDYARGIDPQLDRSIKEALKDIKKNHLSMDGLNKKKPNLKLPKLPI